MTKNLSYISDTITENSTAFIQYTSGSTTAPKGVMLSHANLLAATRNINEFMQIGSWAIESLPMRLSHSFGFARLRCVFDVGAYFLTQLKGLMSDHPIIGDVRGLGLLFGLELVSDRDTKKNFTVNSGVEPNLSKKLQNKGLWLRVGKGTLNMGPPLCINQSEVDEIIHCLDLSLWELEGEMKIWSTI